MHHSAKDSPIQLDMIQRMINGAVVLGLTGYCIGESLTSLAQPARSQAVSTTSAFGGGG